MFSSAFILFLRRQSFWSLTLCLVLFTVVGCGARVSSHKAPITDASAQLLPHGAPFVAVGRPSVLSGLYQRFSGGRTLSSLPIRFLRLPEALAFQNTSRVWVSSDLHGHLAVRRAIEDAEKLLEEGNRRRALAPAGQEGAPAAPGDPSVANWLATTPLPPVWIHSRFVGAMDPSLDLVQTLGEVFGGLQVVGLSDPAEALAVALGVETGRVRDLVSVLKSRGTKRVIRLLSEELPTIVIESQRHGVRIIDYIQDQELGTEAMAAAIQHMKTEANAPNRVAARLGSSASESKVVMAIEHQGWSRMMRGLGEILALQTVVTNSSLIGDGHSLIVKGRMLAKEPSKLLSLSSGLFESSLVELEERDGHLRARLAVRYGENAQWMAGLKDGVAPVEHNTLSGLGRVRVSLALDPVRWRPGFAGKLPEPEHNLSVFLQRALSCGLACFPALWSALPVYGHQLNAGLASIFPELAPMKDAMAHVRSVAMVVDGASGTRRFAALLNFQGDEKSIEKAWVPLVEGFDNAWSGQNQSRSLLIGTASKALESLAELRTRAVVQPSTDVLKVSIGTTPSDEDDSTVEISLRFADDAMILDFDSFQPVQTH